MLLVDALAWESLARRLHGSSSFALQACMLRRVRAEYCIVLYPVLQRGVAVRLPRRPPCMPKGAGRPDRARRWGSHFRPITLETVSGAGTRIRVSVRRVWRELRARNLLHSEKVQQDAGRPHASPIRVESARCCGDAFLVAVRSHRCLLLLCRWAVDMRRSERLVAQGGIPREQRACVHSYCRAAARR